MDLFNLFATTFLDVILTVLKGNIYNWINKNHLENWGIFIINLNGVSREKY